ATVCQNLDRMLLSSLHHHPNYNWLRMNIAQLAMDAQPQRPDIARDHLRHLLQSDQPAVRQMGWMNLTAVDCLVDRRVEPERVERLFDFAGRPIEADLLKSIENAANIVRLDPCSGLSPALIARELDRWLERSDLGESSWM